MSDDSKRYFNPADLVFAGVIGGLISFTIALFFLIPQGHEMAKMRAILNDPIQLEKRLAEEYAKEQDKAKVEKIAEKIREARK